ALPGDDRQLLDGLVERLGVLLRLADAHVERDLAQAGQLHGRPVLEALLERAAHLALVAAAQARRCDCGLCHCDQVFSMSAWQPGRRQWRTFSPLSVIR